MHQFERYLIKNVLMGILLTFLIFLAVYFVFTFIGSAGDLTKVGFFPVFLHILYQAPSDFYFILPLATLLGTLAALGNLASHFELTAMRSLGFSVLKMTRALMGLGLVLAIVMFLLGSFVGPFFAKKALMIDFDFKKGEVLLGSESLWLKSDQDFVYIQKTVGQRLLEGVVKYHFQGQKLDSISWAKQAIYEKGKWHLKEVSIVHLSEEGVQRQTLNEVVWPDLVPPKLLDAVSSDVKHLNLVNLYRYLSYRKINGLDSRTYELKIWQIYSGAISIMVLILIAIPFSFGHLRSASFGMRIMIGVALGITFFLLNRFFGPLALLMNWSAAWGAFLPTFIFLILSAFFFWRLL